MYVRSVKNGLIRNDAVPRIPAKDAPVGIDRSPLIPAEAGIQIPCAEADGMGAGALEPTSEPFHLDPGLRRDAPGNGEFRGLSPGRGRA